MIRSNNDSVKRIKEISRLITEDPDILNEMSAYDPEDDPADDPREVPGGPGPDYGAKEEGEFHRRIAEKDHKVGKHKGDEEAYTNECHECENFVEGMKESQDHKAGKHKGNEVWYTENSNCQDCWAIADHQKDGMWSGRSHEGGSHPECPYCNVEPEIDSGMKDFIGKMSGVRRAESDFVDRTDI